LQRNAIQHGSLGVDSNIYVKHIYTSQLPLDTLFVDANKVDNYNNAGNLMFNSQGWDYVNFGPKAYNFPSAPYTFSYGGPFSNLTVAFNNPQQTATTLQFFNDNSTTKITNSRIDAYSNSSTTTMDLYTLYDLRIESNQRNVYLQTIGLPAFWYSQPICRRNEISAMWYIR
jgi:hypothetical protein